LPFSGCPVCRAFFTGCLIPTPFTGFGTGCGFIFLILDDLLDVQGYFSSELIQDIQIDYNGAKRVITVIKEPQRFGHLFKMEKIK
jgi:hypothetical protein